MTNLRIGLLQQVADAGYAHRIMLSSDRCRVTETKRHGGPGYAHVLNNFIPLLRESGIEDQLIHQILVENPANIFSFEPG